MFKWWVKFLPIIFVTWLARRSCGRIWIADEPMVQPFDDVLIRCPLRLHQAAKIPIRDLWLFWRSPTSEHATFLMIHYTGFLTDKDVREMRLWFESVEENRKANA